MNNCEIPQTYEMCCFKVFEILASLMEKNVRFTRRITNYNHVDILIIVLK